MARRYKKDGFYHVYNRGNKKEKIFLNDQDYGIFDNLLRKYLGRYKIKPLIWCLMPNHFHLLVQISNSEALMLMMMELTRDYSYIIRKKYKWVGHIFQGRYQTKEIHGKQHLETTIKYIANNPVRKGYVKKPYQYKWLKRPSI